MADNTFIEVLKQLLKAKDLDNKIANEVILEHFPNKEFLQGKSSTVLIRKLVPYKLNELKKHKLEEVLKLLNKLYPKLYKVSSTLDNAFSSDIRTVISKRFGYNSLEHKKSKELARLDYEVKGTLLKEAKDKAFKKNNNSQVISTDEVLKMISDNIVSDDPIRRSIALMIASGCRPVELFEFANFTEESNDGPNWVKQDYIAKKRTSENSVVKPIVYFKATRFIELIAEMRKDLHKKYKDFVTDGKLSSAITRKANVIAREVFSDREGFTFYTCRKLYPLLAYELYGKYPNRYGDSVEKVNFYSYILGHKEGSTSAVQNYSHFRLKSEASTSAEVSTEVSLLKTKVEDIQERLDTNDVQKEEKRPKAIDKYAVKEVLYKAQAKKLEPIYEDFLEQNTRRIPQSLLEVLGKSIAPRSVIRRFYREKLEESLAK